MQGERAGQRPLPFDETRQARLFSRSADRLGEGQGESSWRRFAACTVGLVLGRRCASSGQILWRFGSRTAVHWIANPWSPVRRWVTPHRQVLIAQQYRPGLKQAGPILLCAPCPHSARDSGTSAPHVLIECKPALGTPENKLRRSKHAHHQANSRKLQRHRRCH